MNQILCTVPPSRSSTNHVETDPFDNDDEVDYILADEGDDVELNCPVTGYPIPRITWLQLKYAGEYVDEILPITDTKLVINFCWKIWWRKNVISKAN